MLSCLTPHVEFSTTQERRAFVLKCLLEFCICIVFDSCRLHARTITIFQNEKRKIKTWARIGSTCKWGTKRKTFHSLVVFLFLSTKSTWRSMPYLWEHPRLHHTHQVDILTRDIHERNLTFLKRPCGHDGIFWKHRRWASMISFRELFLFFCFSCTDVFSLSS